MGVRKLLQLVELFGRHSKGPDKEVLPRESTLLVDGNGLLFYILSTAEGIDYFRKEYCGNYAYFDYLIKKIEALGNLKTNEINKEYYTQILNEHNLSCNNCFAYLRKGIYPIDSEHLDLFSNIKISQTELYSSVLESVGENNFQSIGYFVIYVLSNRNIYKTTTNNFLHAVVKNYTKH